MNNPNIMIDTDNVNALLQQSFAPINWLKQFREASKNKNGFHVLRKEIFEQTVKVVKNGFYYIDNQKYSLEKFNVIEDTEFFDKPTKLAPSNNDFETNFAVIEADCIETGELLTKAGYNVCVLNMANRQNPGGGVTKGAGAQEENIFRRSNIFMSLYQFKDYSIQYGIERSDRSYPLNRNAGGIYSKNVTVFRASENNGYAFLKKPFQLSFVTVPAINRPKLDFINGEYFITQSLVEPTKEKIRTILRIAGKFKHDCLVLGAFGCGAFKNPPHHMAKLFKDVFSEDEFKNHFKLIIFAILDDHNSWRKHNPEGNILPFLKEFESKFAH